MADSGPLPRLDGGPDHGEATSSESCWQVRVQSNFSLSSRHLLGVILGLSLLTLALAAYPTSLGLWPIGVIALLQALVVAWLLFQAWRRAWSQETIAWQDGRLRVCRETADGTERHELDGHWVRLTVNAPKRPMAPPQLLLVCQGRGIEIGRSLNGEQRLQLAARLRRHLAQSSAWRNPVMHTGPGT